MLACWPKHKTAHRQNSICNPRYEAPARFVVHGARYRKYHAAPRRTLRPMWRAAATIFPQRMHLYPKFILVLCWGRRRLWKTRKNKFASARTLQLPNALAEQESKMTRTRSLALLEPASRAGDDRQCRFISIKSMTIHLYRSWRAALGGCYRHNHLLVQTPICCS